VKRIEECVVGIVGLGLMGGAVAMALRQIGPAPDSADTVPKEPARILACDRDSAVLAAAKAAGLVDGASADPREILPHCDLVYLCLNPSTLLDFMEQHMADFKSGALLTDIAGVKGMIVESMEKTLRDDLDFIPGHPMAGSEKWGFAEAIHCSFKGKNYILTPLKRNKSENMEFIKSLIYRMGFALVTETSAEEHDRKIAFTSQLCHVIAAALIDCEDDTAITRFGGGSFEDLTRIAMLNVPMWTELFIENKSELLKRIEQFEGSLDIIKNLISGNQAAELEKQLSLVRDRRVAMAR
jgi:prephenate dehydrogenase